MNAKKPKGHWPAGKRRNPPCLDAIRILKRVAGRESNKQIAKLLGCDDKTVAKWLRGEDYPSRERAELIRKRLIQE